VRTPTVELGTATRRASCGIQRRRAGDAVPVRGDNRPVSKRRTPIPPKVAAEVEFRSDRTCCVCRNPHLQHQLHHLDGDASNNDPDNLAVLCLQHHAEAEVKGGVGRKLSADEIRRFRCEWYAVVESQRGHGDIVARAPGTRARRRVSGDLSAQAPSCTARRISVGGRRTRRSTDAPSKSDRRN